MNQLNKINPTQVEDSYHSRAVSHTNDSMLGGGISEQSEMIQRRTGDKFVTLPPITKGMPNNRQPNNIQYFAGEEFKDNSTTIASQKELRKKSGKIKEYEYMSPPWVFEFNKLQPDEQAKIRQEKQWESIQISQEDEIQIPLEKVQKDNNDWECKFSKYYSKFNGCPQEYKGQSDRWQMRFGHLICKKCLQVKLAVMNAQKEPQYFNNCAFRYDIDLNIMNEEQKLKYNRVSNSKGETVYQLKDDDKIVETANDKLELKTWTNQSVESISFDYTGKKMTCLCQHPDQNYDSKEIDFTKKQTIRYIIKIYKFDEQSRSYELIEETPLSLDIPPSYALIDEDLLRDQHSLLIEDEDFHKVLLFDKTSQRLFIAKPQSKMSLCKFYIQPIKFNNTVIENISEYAIMQFYCTSETKVSFTTYDSSYSIKGDIYLGESNQQQEKYQVKFGQRDSEDVQHNYSQYIDRKCARENICKRGHLNIITYSTLVDIIYSVERHNNEIIYYQHQLKDTSIHRGICLNSEHQFLAIYTDHGIEIHAIKDNIIQKVMTQKKSDEIAIDLLLSCDIDGTIYYLSSDQLFQYNIYTMYQKSHCKASYQSDYIQYNNNNIMLSNNTFAIPPPPLSNILKLSHNECDRVCDNKIFLLEDYYSRKQEVQQIMNEIVPSAKFSVKVILPEIDIIIYSPSTINTSCYIYRSVNQQLYQIQSGFKYISYACYFQANQKIFKIFFHNNSSLLCLVITDKSIASFLQKFEYKGFIIGKEGDKLINYDDCSQYSLYKFDKIKYTKLNSQSIETLLSIEARIDEMNKSSNETQKKDITNPNKLILQILKKHLECINNFEEILNSTYYRTLLIKEFVILYANERIHFISKQTFKHCLSIFFKFNINDVKTNDIDDGTLYIQDRSSMQYLLLNLNCNKHNNLQIQQIIDDNIYSCISLDKEENRISFLQKRLQDVSNEEDEANHLAKFKIINSNIMKDQDWFSTKISNFDETQLEKIFEFNPFSQKQLFQVLIENKKDGMIDKLAQKFENQENYDYINLDIHLPQACSNIELIFNLPNILQNRLLDPLIKYIIAASEKSNVNIKYSSVIDKYLLKIQEAGIDIAYLLESPILFQEIEKEVQLYKEIGDQLPLKMFPIKTVYYNTIQTLFPNEIEKNNDDNDDNDDEIVIIENANNNEGCFKTFKRKILELYWRFLYSTQIFMPLINVKTQHEIITFSERASNFKTEKEMMILKFNVVKLKERLNKDNSLEFLQKILEISEDDQLILDSPAIRTIIDYKWITYTKFFYVIQFLSLIVFYVSFIVDINYQLQQQKREDELTAFIVTRTICLSILGFYLYLELKILILNRLKILEYFNDPWNINDVFLIIVYPIYVYYGFEGLQIYQAEIKVLQCLIVVSIFIKLCFLLRIFDQLSYLVSMFGNVLKGLRYFLLFLGIVIGAFATVIAIILQQDNEYYHDVSAISYYVIALRRVISDNDISEILNTKYPIIGWILWIVIVIIGNIVFMNFVIAVVGTSYGKYMESSVTMQYQNKLSMIIEREAGMSNKLKEKNQEEWFPNYILKITDQKEEEDDDENQQQWQVAVKQIKRAFDKNTNNVQNDIKNVKEDIKNILAEIRSYKSLGDPSYTLMQTFKDKEKPPLYVTIKDGAFTLEKESSTAWFLEQSMGCIKLFALIGNQKLYLGSDIDTAIVLTKDEESKSCWTMKATRDKNNEYYFKKASPVGGKKYLGESGSLTNAKSEDGTKWLFEKVK